MRGVRVTTVAVWKAISVSYSEYVSVVLDIQHAKRMRRNTNLLPFCPSHPFHTISLEVLFSEKSY
jgi:hypothetical protein